MSQTSNSIVLVSNHKPLVDMLREKYTPEPIEVTSTIEEIQRDQGRQDVINFLVEQMAYEEATQLGLTPT